MRMDPQFQLITEINHKTIQNSGPISETSKGQTTLSMSLRHQSTAWPKYPSVSTLSSIALAVYFLH